MLHSHDFKLRFGYLTPPFLMLFNISYLTFNPELRGITRHIGLLIPAALDLILYPKSLYVVQHVLPKQNRTNAFQKASWLFR